MAKATPDEWDQLTRDLSARVAAFAPDWTEPSGDDPGITLVELFGFLTESFLSRGDVSPVVRTRLDAVLALLLPADNPDCQDETLTRPHYYFGRLLSADDLEREQSYHRTRHRRHNRLVHGHGIVRGLEVSLESPQSGQVSRVHVSPGVAIAPDGEELVVCDPVTVDVDVAGTLGYVTASLFERPIGTTPEGEHAHVEESARIAVVEDVPSASLAIGRVRHGSAGWRADATFRPARVR